jgi:hypothetical protein
MAYTAKTEAAAKLSRVHRRSICPQDLVDANEKPEPDEKELETVRGYAMVRGPNE